MTVWIVAHQPLLFMGFSRQEYWSGKPFLSPGDLPDLEFEPRRVWLSCVGGRFFAVLSHQGSLFLPIDTHITLISPWGK